VLRPNKKQSFLCNGCRATRSEMKTTVCVNRFFAVFNEQFNEMHSSLSFKRKLSLAEIVVCSEMVNYSFSWFVPSW
jgi:hypothetical protein